MFFIAKSERHFTKTIRIVAPTSQAGKLRYRDTTENSCAVISLVAKPRVFTTPFYCCSHWGMLHRKLHALSGEVSGEDRAELTWIGFGISNVWIGKPPPPLRDSQFLPVPSTQGKGRAGLSCSCSLSSLTLSQQSPWRWLMWLFPFCASPLKTQRLQGLGEGPKYTSSVKDERSLHCLRSHLCGTLRCCSGGQRNTHLWKLGRFSKQWQHLLCYIVPVLIPYRTGAFQQWLRRGYRE